MAASLQRDKPEVVHVFRFLHSGGQSPGSVDFERFRNAWDSIRMTGASIVSRRESEAIELNPYSYRCPILQELWIGYEESGGERKPLAELCSKGGVQDLPDWPCLEELYTHDRVVVRPPTQGKRVNVVALIKRKKQLSLEQFREYWVNVHGPLVVKLPHIEDYVQCRTVDEAYRFGEPRWDGIAILGAPDLDRCKSMLASPEFLQGARPHADRFLDEVVVTLFRQT